MKIRMQSNKRLNTFVYDRILLVGNFGKSRLKAPLYDATDNVMDNVTFLLLQTIQDDVKCSDMLWFSLFAKHIFCVCPCLLNFTTAENFLTELEIQVTYCSIVT